MQFASFAEETVLFGATAVENEFIMEYMLQAPGDFVRVYLYMLFQCQYPQAGNSRARVYVRRGRDGEVEFRLWQADHPEVWERHPWLSLSVVQNAARLYKEERNQEADPLKLYDLAVARTLLREDEA